VWWWSARLFIHPSMDAGEGGGAPAAAAAVSNGFVHAVVRWCFSPLFFWLFTVALVAAIHLASTYISPSRYESMISDFTRIIDDNFAGILNFLMFLF
jgi:hypothetical protein